MTTSLLRQRCGQIASQSFDAARYLANVFGLAVITAKGTALIFVQMWLRWTLPRLRIDQVMTTCFKYLVPISCFLFLGAAVWPLALAYLHGGRYDRWLPKRPLGDSVPRRRWWPRSPNSRRRSLATSKEKRNEQNRPADTGRSPG